MSTPTHNTHCWHETLYTQLLEDDARREGGGEGGGGMM
jgi:hypothetical protein